MTILDEIFAHKVGEVAARRSSRPLAQVRREAETAPPALDFVAALRCAQSKPALIAEVKCASPSRGFFLNDFDPLRLASIYQQNGAAAVSVLTDERYFKGRLEYLADIARFYTQHGQRLPLLRKDFIFDAYQVYEARAAGADAVLLIAAHLQPDHLSDLSDLCHELGMAALVEVHTQAELERVMPIRPSLVGINNRDLRDFTMRLDTTLKLRPMIPPEICLVAESGIHHREDVRHLAAAGVDAILVGEALVTAPDVAAKVRSLLT